jgi:hypothetical protein
VVRRRLSSAGGASRAELFNVRVDVPRALSGRRWRIVLALLRGVLQFIRSDDGRDGRLVKPEPLQVGAADNVVKQHKTKNDFFLKANSYAKSMNSSSVTDAVYQKIMNKNTAHEAWEALKLNFEASSKDQLFKICTKFFASSWINGEDVSTHVAKLKNL